MAELKTRRTDASVQEFLDSVADEERRRDCRTVLRIMKAATHAPPKMWSTSIVGFGSYRYRYRSGREGEWFLAGFSPRKQDLTLYLMGAGFAGYGALLEKLGKHRTGRACLYLKRLADVDLDVLRTLVKSSVEHLARRQA
jgi:hypothetical protein